MTDLTHDQTYDLITRNLQEVLGADAIKSIIAKGETVKCYWGKRLLIDCSVLSVG